MRRKYVSRTETIDVEVDLSLFSDEAILEEAADRGLPTPVKDELIVALMAMRNQRFADATAALEQIIWPKWQTPEACAAEFSKRAAQ